MAIVETCPHCLEQAYRSNHRTTCEDVNCEHDSCCCICHDEPEEAGDFPIKMSKMLPTLDYDSINKPHFKELYNELRKKLLSQIKAETHPMKRKLSKSFVRDLETYPEFKGRVKFKGRVNYMDTDSIIYRQGQLKQEVHGKDLDSLYPHPSIIKLTYVSLHPQVLGKIISQKTTKSYFYKFSKLEAATTIEKGEENICNSCFCDAVLIYVHNKEKTCISCFTDKFDCDCFCKCGVLKASGECTCVDKGRGI